MTLHSLFTDSSLSIQLLPSVGGGKWPPCLVVVALLCWKGRELMYYKADMTTLVQI